MTLDLLDLAEESEDDRKRAESSKKQHYDRLAAERRELVVGPLRRRMADAAQGWTLPELPSLDRFDEVILDLETTGLRWWDGDRLIGAGLHLPDGSTRYLPVRHRGHENIPEGQFFEWMHREFRGKRVVNIRTKFDLHTLREDGVDLEEQGCTFGDVAHYAALLDDDRRQFNQRDLARDFLGDDGGKVTAADGFELDPTMFAEYPPGLIAQRAEADVLTVHRLLEAMRPRLAAEDLTRVAALEDSVIPVVVEMEHNGAPLNEELLADWCRRSERDVEDALLTIKREAGFNLDSPTNREGILKLMAHRGHSNCRSTADDHLEVFKDDPIVQQLRRAMQIDSLRSKYLLKYQRSIQRDPKHLLRYELHQLAYSSEHGRGGTVSGRFSSAGVSPSEGANIQQVFAVRNQQKERPFTADYIIRKLFVPKNGLWLAADASQIEYRLFAHYADDPRIVAAYNNDPKTDYHQLVQELILAIAMMELHREATKRVNFAQIYGAGIKKMAQQLGVAYEVAERLSKVYHETFPGVKPLVDLASKLARERGFVHTILGRRARFHPCPCGHHDRQHKHEEDDSSCKLCNCHQYRGSRMYSALNRVIQGGAADVNKVVLVEVHKRRRELGLTTRFTVHDELDSDLQDKAALPAVKEILNTQYVPFKVPILWDVGAGPNWAEAKA